MITPTVFYFYMDEMVVTCEMKTDLMYVYHPLNYNIANFDHIGYCNLDRTTENTNFCRTR